MDDQQDVNTELKDKFRVTNPVRSDVRRLKASRRDKAFALVALVIAIAESSFDGNARIAIAIGVSLAVVSVWTVWMTRFVRSALKSEVNASPKTPRSYPPITHLFIPLVLIVASMQLFGSVFETSESQTADRVAQALLIVSILMTFGFIYFVNPLLEHLKRPFDSIESRAERDAAALMFLVVLLILGLVGAGVAWGSFEVDQYVMRMGAGLAALALIGVYYLLRQVFIWKRS